MTMTNENQNFAIWESLEQVNQRLKNRIVDLEQEVDRLKTDIYQLEDKVNRLESQVESNNRGW